MSAVIAKFARQLTESMMREDDFSRLELDLRGCVSNYRYFRSLLEPSTKLLVLVKANAYGHGAVEFAAMMQRAGADYLAVASSRPGWNPASPTWNPSTPSART